MKIEIDVNKEVPTTLEALAHFLLQVSSVESKVTVTNTPTSTKVGIVPPTKSNEKTPTVSKEVGPAPLRKNLKKTLEPKDAEGVSVARAKLVSKGHKLGLKFRSDISDATLTSRIEAVEAKKSKEEAKESPTIHEPEGEPDQLTEEEQPKGEPDQPKVEKQHEGEPAEFTEEEVVEKQPKETGSIHDNAPEDDVGVISDTRESPFGAEPEEGDEEEEEMTESLFGNQPD